MSVECGSKGIDVTNPFLQEMRQEATEHSSSLPGNRKSSGDEGGGFIGAKGISGRTSVALPQVRPRTSSNRRCEGGCEGRLGHHVKPAGVTRIICDCARQEMSLPGGLFVSRGT